MRKAVLILALFFAACSPDPAQQAREDAAAVRSGGRWCCRRENGRVNLCEQDMVVGVVVVVDDGGVMEIWEESWRCEHVVVTE